jgi:type I restriction enzyme S subunit
MSAMRPGNRQTEVGVIPEGWGDSALADYEPFITSGSRGWAERYSDAGDLFVRITNLTRETIRLDLSDTKFVRVPADDAEARRTALKVGDLLVSITADIGIIGYVDTDVPAPAYINQHVACVRLDDDAVHPRFVAYFLASEPAQHRFRAITDVGAKTGINLTTVGKLRTAVPPFPEQKAIAEALGDADALIEALEALIAKKRAIKQGAMQDLLTGQRRLPGFQGEWCECQLGSLGSFAKGSGVKKDEADSGPLPCVRYGELYTHHTDIIRRFNSHISAEVAKGALRLRVGDILFAGSGETKEEIGKCAALVEDVEAYAGGDIVVVRPSGSSAEFLGYYLNMPDVQRQKASKGQGDAVVHISSRALASIDLKLPPTLDEQRAIAAVLSDMDAEIAALEDKLAKARDVKQGMMQVLLTGEIRLL